MTPIQRQRLKSFLYILMRNELPTGKVAYIVEEIEKSFVGDVTEAKFTAKGLADYAEELMERILDAE